MEETLQEFQHLKIKLEVINSAINFEKTKHVGNGGFGKVYEAELSLSKGLTKVAIKRLNPDPKHGQGKVEFLKEIMVLSRYKHKNLLSLLGYCYEGKEVILVYEYASRLSLDRHLSSPNLTWARRLKICLDAAKGLCYLHDPRGTHERLIHRDMKSANILLDDHWNAKVSDFGLSIMGPANGPNSVVIANAGGTRGYLDPQYVRTQTLTKESDVYSFGVVLFEVLSGKCCIKYKDKVVEKYFVPTWIKSYKDKMLNDIIFKHPTIQPLDQSALEEFSDIAYRCLNESRKHRPMMDEVIIALEAALESQKYSEWIPPVDYEDIIKTAEPPLKYSSNGELRKLLSKGVLVNSGKTWFSLNEKGEHFEMISFAHCLDLGSSKYESEHKSRFVVGTYHSKNGRFKVSVKGQFLSLGITYSVNLVFKFINPFKVSKFQLLSLKYRLQGETKTSVSHLAYERGDGWWMCELYQYTSDQRVVDLEIMFDGYEHSYSFIEAEGIEFRPLEKVELKVSDDEDEKLDVNTTHNTQPK